MRLDQLIKPFELLSQDERMFIVRRARNNKYIAKPAAKARQAAATEKVEKRAKTAGKAALKKTIDQLTPEQRAELIRSLTSGS